MDYSLSASIVWRQKRCGVALCNQAWTTASVPASCGGRSAAAWRSVTAGWRLGLQPAVTTSRWGAAAPHREVSIRGGPQDREPLRHYGAPAVGTPGVLCILDGKKTEARRRTNGCRADLHHGYLEHQVRTW